MGTTTNKGVERVCELFAELHLGIDSSIVFKPIFGPIEIEIHATLKPFCECFTSTFGMVTSRLHHRCIDASTGWNDRD
jgi:hypothetical protein